MRYRPGLELVLKNLSLRVRGGEKVRGGCGGCVGCGQNLGASRCRGAEAGEAWRGPPRTPPHRLTAPSPPPGGDRGPHGGRQVVHDPLPVPHPGSGGGGNPHRRPQCGRHWPPRPAFSADHHPPGTSLTCTGHADQQSRGLGGHALPCSVAWGPGLGALTHGRCRAAARPPVMDPKGSGVAWPSQLLSSDLLGHQWRPGSRDRSGTPLSDGLCPGLPVPQLGITYRSFWFLWSVFFFFFFC